VQLYNKGLNMDWISYSKIGAGILTAVILYLVFKEIKAVVKRSNSGEVSKKCDLD